MLRERASEILAGWIVRFERSPLRFRRTTKAATHTAQVASLVDSLTVAATALRSRPVDQKSKIISRVRQEVWPMIEEGSIRPVIETRMAVQEAARAHALMASSAHFGKIVLTV